MEQNNKEKEVELKYKVNRGIKFFAVSVSLAPDDRNIICGLDGDGRVWVKYLPGGHDWHLLAAPKRPTD